MANKRSQQGKPQKQLKKQASENQDLLAILRERKCRLPTGNLASSAEVTSNLTRRVDDDACLPCAAASPSRLRVYTAASSRTTGSLRAGGSG